MVFNLNRNKLGYLGFQTGCSSDSVHNIYNISITELVVADKWRSAAREPKITKQNQASVAMPYLVV
mgnify:CR=1 FL=1